MKFNCGPSRWEKMAARSKYLDNWHKFFCLWPRRMDVGKNDCRWLEYVERKRSGGAYLYYWDYRPIKK